MEKKIYQAPSLLIQTIQLEGLIALSTMEGNADKNGEVLSKGQNDWDIWSDEE
ncbi:MAG: hypothetical protein IJ700_06615 [Bacteroidaceae bacterium]|nr:hypothetical protein [Bacteroidaceae bacterium]